MFNFHCTFHYHDADDYLDHVGRDNDKEDDDLENEENAKMERGFFEYHCLLPSAKVLSMYIVYILYTFQHNKY